MRNLAIAITIIVGLLISIVALSLKSDPVTYDSSDTEITKIVGFSSEDTIRVNAGESVNATFTVYFQLSHTEPKIIEFRLNNEIHQLQQEAMELGVPGTLYTRQIQLSAGDIITTQSDNGIQIHLDGFAQLTVVHNPFSEKMGYVFVISLLTAGVVCLIMLFTSLKR